MEAKTGSDKDGLHRKEVPRATQKKPPTRNFGCRSLGAFVFHFGGVLYVFVRLFGFLKLFSREEQLGDPSENIQGDRKLNNNISFLFSIGFEGQL